MKSSFFEHFYDLTGPKYAEKYEDSESGLKSIHFLANMPEKHDFEFIFTFFNRGRAGVIRFEPTVLNLQPLKSTESIARHEQWAATVV